MAKRMSLLGIYGAYWRLTRGATLGAQGVVIDEEERVLLVRHGYRPGWHFPGGGIEWGESARDALARELHEEAGVLVEGEPRLHGLFCNTAVLPSDHIALFVVREWARDHIPKPNREIVETGFFARNQLPSGTSQGVLRRLGEIFDGADLTPHW